MPRRRELNCVVEVETVRDHLDSQLPECDLRPCSLLHSTPFYWEKVSQHIFNKENRYSHVSSSFFWTARYERLPFASLINLRRPCNKVVEKDDVGMLTLHTAARRKLIALVRAWGSGARASISFWERDYNSTEISIERESEERKHTLPAWRAL